VADTDTLDAATAARRDHLDAAATVAGPGRSGATIGYPGVVANVTGNPAMSAAPWWNAGSLPIGAHFLGRTATRRHYT
jgi:hypothetical protein